MSEFADIYYIGKISHQCTLCVDNLVPYDMLKFSLGFEAWGSKSKWIASCLMDE